MTRALFAVLVVIALALAACGGVGTESAGGDASVTELTSVDQLATAFDADKGKPRLVLLLSPT